MSEVRVFAPGDLVLQSGITLADAKLVYQVQGRPNAAGDNVILYCTRFGGSHEDNAFLIGPGMALDPDFPRRAYLYVLYTYDAPPGGSAPVWNDDCPTPPGGNADGSCAMKLLNTTVKIAICAKGLSTCQIHPRRLSF